MGAETINPRLPKGKPGPRVRCYTRALKNARHLQQVAPTLFAKGASAEGFGTGLSLELLSRLHRLLPDSPELRGDPQLAKILEKHPLPLPGRKARDTLFSGTVHFAQITFQTSNGDLVIPTADMNQIVQYARHAIVPISECAAQYGTNTVSISSTLLPFTASVPDGSFTKDDLKGFVNDIATENGLGPDSSIFVVVPEGITSPDVGANSGYHDKANTPFIVAGVFAQNLTLADIPDVYAMVISHEIAEMIVDPNANLNNPEVCDPCDVNCTNLTRIYLDGSDRFLGANQASPPSGFDFTYYICAVVKPAGASGCGATTDQCEYDPADPDGIEWTSVAEGRSTPGAPVTAVVTGPDRVTLFLADPGGGIFTASGNAKIGWGEWTSVAEGRSTPGAPVTAVVTGPDRITLFLADPNGGIFTASGNAGTGWGEWTSVAEGRSTSGAPVTAVVTGPNRVTLFLADPGGGIFTASGNAKIGWGEWTSVAEGRSTPGAPVTAVVTGPDRITLFLADPNGGIFTASGNAGTGWGEWTSVAEGRSTPGAPVTAVVTGPNRVTLFVADPGGGIFTASGNAKIGWGEWTSVAEGRSTPGAPVAAVVTAPDRVTLYVADPGGGIFTASGNANVGWGQWTSVAEGRSTPGAPVAAVVTGPNRVTLFVADPNGGVFTATTPGER